MTCLRETVSNQNYVFTKNGIKSKERWKILLHIKDTLKPGGEKKKVVKIKKVQRKDENEKLS